MWVRIPAYFLSHRYCFCEYKIKYCYGKEKLLNGKCISVALFVKYQKETRTLQRGNKEKI